MRINKGFNKNFGKWFLTDFIKAVKKYDLIRDQDNICVALSGGKDSVTLLYILYCLQNYSYFNFSFSAFHIRLDDHDTDILRKLCLELDCNYNETDLFFKNDRSSPNDCYLCSRLRRSVIADHVKKNQIDKVAYGHNADDAAETFLMNMIQHRTLGTFSPKVKFEKKPMTLIRPMIYLDSKTIKAIHKYAGLPLLRIECESKDQNIRMNYRTLIKRINKNLGIRDFSVRLVQALENPDQKNSWTDLIRKTLNQ